MPWKYIPHILSEIKYPRYLSRSPTWETWKCKWKYFCFPLKRALGSKIMQSLVFISLYLYVSFWKYWPKGPLHTSKQTQSWVRALLKKVQFGSMLSTHSKKLSHFPIYVLFIFLSCREKIKQKAFFCTKLRSCPFPLALFWD